MTIFKPKLSVASVLLLTITPTPLLATDTNLSNLETQQVVYKISDTDLKDKLELSKAYLFGQGKEQDVEQGFSMLLELSLQGYAEAQSDLAELFVFSIQDDKEAVKWYRKAAEQGHADAQHNLGTMYNQGKGVPKNDKEAVKWYRKAAEQGHAEAQFQLGLMHTYGVGVLENHKKGLSWLRKAAEQEHATAQKLIGTMYVLGLGTPQNKTKAYMWFALSKYNGDKEASELMNNSLMNSINIDEAQRMAQQCLDSNYKDC
ncbi:tetratricopeptide repeat protein [Vibrio parahaemolyticus]|uniref:Tetratricopeptide repeat protein n=1 Tax=Vibrio parahaemolyticus TaxID=670 RepID=A0AAW8Q0T4_VIBPH|nr:tetratricopeptide repeat protein [Vibrio parahaemolyticus]MDS1821269.1 tetratricopeptide repeat protein [Vibrio parahaemolyticus]